MLSSAGLASGGMHLRAAAVGTVVTGGARPSSPPHAWLAPAQFAGGQHLQQQQQSCQPGGQQRRLYSTHSSRGAAAAALPSSQQGAARAPTPPHAAAPHASWSDHPHAFPAHWSHWRRRQHASAVAAASATSPVGQQQVQHVGEPEVALQSILEFQRGPNFILGRVIGKEGGAWRVEDASGTVFSVRDREVTYVLPGTAYSTEDLTRVESTAGHAAADPSLLELAWEMSDPGSLYTVAEMAAFLYGDSGGASCAAAHRLLRDDRLFFKQAGRAPPAYSPRTAAQVEELRARAVAEAAVAADREAFVAAAAAAAGKHRSRKPGKEAWAAGPHAARMAALEEYAVCSADPFAAGGHGPAVEALEALGRTPAPHAAADVLQELGYWPPHLQLGLLAAGITERFPEELEDRARQLAAAPPPDPDAATRMDLTHHTVYTIDDASTTEIDDGLSVERMPDRRTRLWVHIADPTRWVSPGDALDLEARRRTKSLYLPTTMVPMFPLSLAEGPFSLVAGQRCAALSVGAVVAPDGSLALEDIVITPSTVTPTHRLTYDTVDEMLAMCSEEEEPDLHTLLQVAELRRRHRTDAGATEINMPECCVEVKRAHLDVPDVSITAEYQFGSEARQLVAEMMILAGEAAGMLGGKLGLPLPYRGQAEPVLPTEEELEAVPEGPCRAVMLRMRMTRSLTQAEGPLAHAGLGLQAYVQITSPIRRYGDLMAHWQLKAALRGQAPPLGEAEMTQAVEAVAETTQRVLRLEREVTNYWVAEYFRQVTAEHPGAVWSTTFLCWFKQEAGLCRVLFDGMGLEALVRIDRPAAPGDNVWVRCGQVDVRQGVWRLEEARLNSFSFPDEVVNFVE